MHNRPAFPSRSLKLILQQSKWGDYVVAAMFVVFASASVWLPSLAPENPQARLAQVTIANRRARDIDLRQPQTVSFQGLRGEVIVEVTRQRIRVRSSVCPNQFCVKQGFVSRPGQMLVCVPNRLVILITGTQQSDLDAITY